MNTKRFFALFIIAFLFAVAVLPALAEGTNAVATVGTNGIAIPPGVSQVIDLLPAKAKAIALSVLAFLGSASAVLGLFSGWISRKLRDWLNSIAVDRAGTEGMDGWLRKLFSNPIYQFFAILGRFVHVTLPTVADLDRSLKLQAEAVADSKDVGVDRAGA